MTGTALTRLIDANRDGALSRRTIEDAVEVVPATRVRGTLILGLGFALMLFGGLGAWAALAPLKSAAVAPGEVQVVGDRKAVQHLEGGIVRDILVAEGDQVRRGDVLVRLDRTRMEAQLDILSGQLASALALEARLAAEAADLTEIAFGAELEAAAAANPAIAAMLETQREAFRAGNEARRGEAQILAERVTQLNEELRGLAANLEAVDLQLAIVVEELADAETLLAKGNIAKPRVLALRRAHAGAIGDRGRLLATIARVRQQVIEIEERKLQIRRDRLGAIAAERQATADRIADLRERLPAAEDTLARLDILAPADGTVIGLAVNTAGEVIGPGQTLMEIVPGEADYIVRTAVRPADIDVLAPGLPARVRLTAYSFRSSPPLEGRVVLVSADRFTHPQTGETYFRVDVAIDAASLARLPDVRALPGMQAEVMIETGEQTMAEYLFDPLLAGLETGLREH